MAYSPNPNQGPIRDKAYPSQIAAERPALATRIHCVDDYEDRDVENSIRGEKTDDEHDSRRVDLFNRQLREGHGGEHRED